MRLRTPKLTCRELVELVTDYLEGALHARDRRRFDAHIAGCDGCRAYLAQMRVTIDALGELPEERIAPDARRELMELFADWKR